jgi:hypothetical protein
MTPATRLLRTLAAALVAVSVMLVGGSGHMVLANGVGDIYVADPAMVLELNTGAGNGQVSVDGHICVPGGVISAATAAPAASGSPAASAVPTACPSATVKAPTQLAFSANTSDLSKLYLATANGTPQIYRINIVDLTVQAPITMSANVSAIAHPKGNTLYVALAGSSTLMYVGDSDTTSSNGALMSKGVPDILAADARDTHVVAAKAGATWVAIVDASGSVNYPLLPDGGKVVGAAIARDEGAAYVITSGPNRLYRIDLARHTILWSPTLPETPTAVAALDHYAVVAAGPKLYKVQKSGASLWATLPGDVQQLGADLEAGYVYIATSDTLVARSVAAPADNVARLALPDGAITAMAPVPDKASNLPAGHGKPAATAGTGNGSATGTAKPRKTRAPSTDTISDIVAGKSVDVTTLLLGLASVVIITTVGSRYLIKRLVGE